MLRIFLFMTLLMVSPVVARDLPKKLTYADEAEVLDQAHVRGFIWGLPASVVREEEKARFIEEAKDGALFYFDVIRGIKSSITYEFLQNKLYRVQIFSEKKYTVPQNRLEDLVKIKRDLVKRFGEPVTEDFKWDNERNRKYPDRWGWSVYEGDLSITLIWIDDETQVTAYLGAPEKYKPILAVTYEDIQTKRQRNSKNNNSVKILP